MIEWTEYLKYRAEMRDYDLDKLERILFNSTERYFDTITGRMVAIGRHDTRLLLIPYEAKGEQIVPVTVHATTRRQINLRLRTGRFLYE